MYFTNTFFIVDVEWLKYDKSSTFSLSLLSVFFQHLEDNSDIQELTKYKPHVLLTQENTQIKELQQENKGKLEFENKCLHIVPFPQMIICMSLSGWTVFAELWLSLEEHQYALELIMGRYRKQMLQLMMAKKELDTKPVLSLHEDHAKVWQISQNSL